MNVSENAIFLLVFMIILLSVGFMLWVGNTLHNETVGALKEGNMYYDKYDVYGKASGLAQIGIEFLTSIIVFSLILSSYIDGSSLKDYVLGFISSIFITGMIIYLGSNLYNSFVVSSGEVGIDLMGIPSWFVSHFVHLLVLNLLAGIISFVFKRPTQPSIDVY